MHLQSVMMGGTGRQDMVMVESLLVAEVQHMQCICMQHQPSKHLTCAFKRTVRIPQPSIQASYQSREGPHHPCQHDISTITPAHPDLTDRDSPGLVCALHPLSAHHIRNARTRQHDEHTPSGNDAINASASEAGPVQAPVVEARASGRPLTTDCLGGNQSCANSRQPIAGQDGLPHAMHAVRVGACCQS